MRVRQIGTLVFDANTNIIVDADAQDAPGIGFHINNLYDPQPFSVEIAFKRATRQQALEAVNALARELFSYAQRRQDLRAGIAGGAPVIIEDAAGGATLKSYLRDGSVTLLGVETTATGVIARVRATGTLVASFINYAAATTSLTSLLPYERRVIALSGTSDSYLYKNNLFYSVSNMPGLYNALLAAETLESATAASRIAAINPATATSGITLENWNAGWATLTRANFSSATNGTITFNITTALPFDVYRLFVEISCPSTPGSTARYSVAWGGQPQIYETIAGDRSWYTPALFVRREAAMQLTLNIENVPTGTLAMPLILIPTDGVFVWNVITSPTFASFHSVAPQSDPLRPLETSPDGAVYGTPGFVSGRNIAVFNGVMAQTISGASASLTITSRRIEPAAFA